MWLSFAPISKNKRTRFIVYIASSVHVNAVGMKRIDAVFVAVIRVKTAVEFANYKIIILK